MSDRQPVVGDILWFPAKSDDWVNRPRFGQYIVREVYRSGGVYATSLTGEPPLVAVGQICYTEAQAVRASMAGYKAAADRMRERLLELDAAVAGREVRLAEIEKESPR